MRLICMAVRDRAQDGYMRPFFVPAVGMAVRSFGDEINKHDAGAVMSAHPEDYDLYRLGEWDEETGEFFPEKPKMVAIGKDMVRNVS